MAIDNKNARLYTKIEDKIAILEFGHTASNALPIALLERLSQKFDELSTNPNISIIILKSEGKKAFCAGAFFNELITISNIADGNRFFMGFARVINAMRKCNKLIIGRVQGKAVGGGVGLISSCDYVLATREAAIKLSELTIGIGAFVIAPAVKRKIGVAGFSELSLTPTTWKNAYWAKEKGLYSKVFENQKELDLEVGIMSKRLVSYNPESLMQMKKELWDGTKHWDVLLEEKATISGKLVLSDFTKKALKKFKG